MEKLPFETMLPITEKDAENIKKVHDLMGQVTKLCQEIEHPLFAFSCYAMVPEIHDDVKMVGFYDLKFGDSVNLCLALANSLSDVSHPEDFLDALVDATRDVILTEMEEKIDARH